MKYRIKDEWTGQYVTPAFMGSGTGTEPYVYETLEYAENAAVNIQRTLAKHFGVTAKLRAEPVE